MCVLQSLKILQLLIEWMSGNGALNIDQWRVMATIRRKSSHRAIRSETRLCESKREHTTILKLFKHSICAKCYSTEAN